jgi:phospholipid transport system transporter-binding protein
LAGASASAFRLPDSVRYDNVLAVREAGERALDEAPDGVEFSLAPLRESNSVVVALLLAWVRHARARSKSIRFVEVPADLRNIIELYGVTEILPLEDGGAASAWAIADDGQTANAAGPRPDAP